MVTRRIRWSMLLVASLMFLLTPIAQAKGQGATPKATLEEGVKATCSLGTLNGTFGFLEHGMVLGQLPGGVPPGPYPLAVWGTTTYDGAGNVTGTWMADIGGTFQSGTFLPGSTYQVGADCTYWDKLQVLPELVIETRGTIIGEGMHQEGDYVWTTSGTVMVGTEKRIPPGGCSLETTKGLHGAQEQGEAVPGAQLPGLPPGPWPIVTSATGSYDGAGNMSGTYTISVGGTVVSGSFAGKHFVNPDCTFTDKFSPLPGLEVHHAGTIVGEGPFMEELYMYSDSGTVIVGRAKIQR